MADIKIPPLDERLVNEANYNSFGGRRGDNSKASYESYCNRVLGWDISAEKKEKIIGQIYKKWCEILKQEAQHVSVAVAGPAWNSWEKAWSTYLDKLDKDWVSSISERYAAYV